MGTASYVSPRRFFNTKNEWHGLKLFIKENGKTFITPMFLVILSLGTTDLLFALDSIPAIYGLAQEPYLVFTANVFALIRLYAQLYFLLGSLLKRLIYLSQGLAILLAFIGVKLVLHALHTNELPFINGGEHFDVPGDPDAAEPRCDRQHPVDHRGGQPDGLCRDESVRADRPLRQLVGRDVLRVGDLEVLALRRGGTGRSAPRASSPIPSRMPATSYCSPSRPDSGVTR